MKNIIIRKVAVYGLKEIWANKFVRGFATVTGVYVAHRALKYAYRSGCDCKGKKKSRIEDA